MVESLKNVYKKLYKDRYTYRVWLNKYLKHVSIRITWLLLHTRVTANQVTISEYFLLLLAAVMMLGGDLWYIFIAFVIIQFTNVLDCVDGEIARYKKQSSLVGVHLEDIYHQLVSYAMFFPLGYGIFVQTGWESALLFGFLCSVFSKSTVIPAMFSAIINSRLYEGTEHSNYTQKVGSKAKKAVKNLQGSKMGGTLAAAYEKFKDFWAPPTNILHLNIISLVELVNMYVPFMPPFVLLYLYLVVYSVAMVGKQLVSFVVHYKGKAVERYYEALFGKK